MHKPKVLLIENNSGIIGTLRQYLLNLAYAPEHIVSHNLYEARHKETDAAIMMIPLSEVSFEEDCSIKQLQQQFHHIPIIVLAKKDEEEGALQAVTSGADDYLIDNETNEAVLQKTIQCAMARSDINFRQLFVDSPAPMYISDKETFRFLAVNKACCRQYGYEETEFLQMTVEQIRPVEEVDLFRNAAKTAPQQYHDYGRWKHCKKNGGIIIVNIYAHDTKFCGKQARLVTAIDVSHTVFTEQMLQDKNREIGNILESITDGFFALNKDGILTYVNKECERIFGFRHNEMTGKKFSEVYDNEEYAVFYKQYREAEHNRTNVRFENYISSVGKWLSITMYSTRNGMAVYLVDITERRLIREKLYNDGQQLRAIINNTPDIIWLLDNKGNITVRNEAFRQWMQHLVEDADTHSLPPSVTSNWQEYFDAATGGAVVTFTAMETKGNDLFYREVSLYPVRNVAGDVVNISCFARNVTQQQLRIQKIQLQNEYLEKIAWMHSHEARGPVANILGLASLFDMNDPTDPDNKMMMELIVESSQQLDNVIRKIVADIDRYQLSYGDEEE